ncbi:tryptophan ABC transporter substrate-binding protein [Aerococcus sanguinicola]|uniref:tryptophan ABC transporter substrate-binding protein n=1 Tax=unclassified Aerococcus TaxID=2618060 RepID=UPI0008A35D31|nr:MULTISPECIES: tryptophan ABC transporter substrate-binding protein [unclassified Aerococcus]MDK6233608.1 tryptophan ABC transporter substrate-binding protein [Aerococcus sp. UMB10185]MDK6804182.1 tryptophan ABC transporter substrate-binding protein [Aerococcus sp. UMB7834]OFN01524.1 ABC transporter substrate-binding protein [Aerococcus sp. HMSC062A02]OHO46412.1 ABC transporter substrate-binding protein [Aerococcus sp. HMSC035B07]
MKRFTALGSFLIAALMVLFLAMPTLIEKNKAAQAPKTNSGNQAVTAKALDEDLKVGLLQLMDHPALDQIRQGFYDQLAKRGYVDGENIHIDYQNGQGDQNNLKMISDKFIADDADYLVGIATPAAQALANAAEGNVPVVMGAVANPKSAGLVENYEKPGANITGVSDIPPVKEQFRLIQEILPEAKTIGIIYNSSETNSHANVALAKEVAADMGYEVKEATINSTNDLAQVAEQLANDVDAIWVPNDNSIASSMPTLIAATDSKGIPVFPVVDTMVKDGGLATVGINQYQLGVDTANVTADLMDGQSPADHPIVFTDKTDTYVNKEKADQLGIKLPDSVLEKASDVNEGGH